MAATATSINLKASVTAAAGGAAGRRCSCKSRRKRDMVKKMMLSPPSTNARTRFFVLSHAIFGVGLIEERRNVMKSAAVLVVSRIGFLRIVLCVDDVNVAKLSWKATLQSIAALSMTEMEYIAATEGVKEAIWLQGLVMELGVSQSQTIVFSDSQSAIYLTKNDTYHAIRYHFIRDVVAARDIVVQKISEIVHLNNKQLNSAPSENEDSHV
nr:Retrovirus-related Pol polyprotein from transposon TNT 1-94 [Ipomoea batatas]